MLTSWPMYWRVSVADISLIEMQLGQMLDAERQARLERYKAAWDAYYCRFPKPLTVKKDKPDDNVLLGLARLTVDKGVSFLFGKEVKFELPKSEDGESDLTQDSPEEAFLADCWRVNRKQTTLQKIALNGGVCGHAFMRIIEQQPFPRLLVLDPANVEVAWDQHDIDRVRRYTVEYMGVDPASRKPALYRQVIEESEGGQSWAITDQVLVPPNRVWTTTGMAIWQHDFAPIVHCQNLVMPNEFYGLSDLEADVVQLNKAINFVASNTQAIIRYHAHPKVWGRGFQGKMDVAVDGTIVIPSTTGELRALEMNSDLSSSREFLRDLKQAYHEVSHTPEVATGKVENVGTLSGRALAILYGPLIDRTEQKRLTYGELLQELNSRLLVLGGFALDLVVDNMWPEILPADPKEEADTLLLHQQLGVSKDTIMTKLGYNAEEEASKRDVEAKEAMERALAAFDSGQGEGGRDANNQRDQQQRQQQQQQQGEGNGRGSTRQ